MVNPSELPKISVITPSYNQGQFIEETIRSVLMQKYPNLEYIIIDGGSTDNSVEIIKQYEKQISYWMSEPDRGPVDAINKGWRRATGDIIAYLNSDDIYLPGTLATIAQVFQAKQDALAICGNEFAIDQDGFVIRKSKIGSIDHISLLKLNFIPQPSTFVRRSVLDSIGLMNPEVKYVFDFELWLRLTRIGQIETIPDVLSATRWHNDTITLTKRSQVGEELVKVITDEVENFAPQLTEHEKQEIVFSVNALAVDLHLEKNRLLQSFRYAIAAGTAANFTSNLEIVRKYSRYFKAPFSRFKNSVLKVKRETTVMQRSSKIHWSTFCRDRTSSTASAVDVSAE